MHGCINGWIHDAAWMDGAMARLLLNTYPIVVVAEALGALCHHCSHDGYFHAYPQCFTPGILPLFCLKSFPKATEAHLA